MKHYAVIVAGGSGSRMQTETPKQFLLLNNRPVIMHTIKAFAGSVTKPEIIVVLNQSQHSYWKALCMEFEFKIPHTIIAGGNERFYSVKSAIESLSEHGFVAVHDAVRPLISSRFIDHCFLEAELKGNVIAAIKSSDSVRVSKGNKTLALNRNEVYLVQTPQIFNLYDLKKAYQQEYSSNFTDDASVVEAYGKEINIIEGERSNIKITYPTDLEFAEVLLRHIQKKEL